MIESRKREERGEREGISQIERKRENGDDSESVYIYIYRCEEIG